MHSRHVDGVSKRLKHFVFSVCFVSAMSMSLGFSMIHDANAFSKDGLIELFETACFGSYVPSTNDRIVKWNSDKSIKLTFSVDYADEELKDWIRTEIGKYLWAVTDGSSLSIEHAGSFKEADIVILSQEKIDLLLSDDFKEELSKKLSSNEIIHDQYESLIRELYRGERDLLSFAAYEYFEPNTLALSKFVGFIAPNSDVFRSSFLRLLSAALGCGNGEHIPLKTVNSVHTVFAGEAKVSDMLILDFLYRSNVANGESKNEAVRQFQRWLDERRFLPKFEGN